MELRTRQDDIEGEKRDGEIGCDETNRDSASHIERSVQGNARKRKESLAQEPPSDSAQHDACSFCDQVVERDGARGKKYLEELDGDRKQRQ